MSAVSLERQAALLPQPSAAQTARAIIAHHSKSFALASRLLPGRVRDDAVVLYAYCRRVDDAIDSVEPSAQPAALRALRAELDALYAGASQSEAVLAALQAVIVTRAIPRQPFDDLLAGMEMDAVGARYDTREQLILYSYRVAGTVGILMCHVMGVRDPVAFEHGKDLGIAMQLTNIARDVREDWERGRLYLPEDLMRQCGAAGLQKQLGRPLPATAAPALRRAVATLLSWADDYYRSGDTGLRYLSFRCRTAVYAARLIYSAIGSVLRRRDCDALAGRAVVSSRRKLGLALQALLWTALATLVGACAHTQEAEPSNVAQRARYEVSTDASQAGAVSDAESSLDAARAEAPVPPQALEPTEAPVAAPAANPVLEAPAVPTTGEVIVDVLGVQSAEGNLLLALFRDSKAFPDRGQHAFGKKVVRPRAGNVRVIFREVPSGPFAVTVHHDADKNFKMETGLFGMPQEGYGFSRDASAPFGPPGFDAAKLTLKAGERKRVPIRVRY